MPDRIYYILFYDLNVFPYNLLMSAGGLECWNEYPARNKSFICTSSRKNVESRLGGSKFLIIPVNPKQEIAICPADDLWFGFERFFKILGLTNFDLSDFNDYFFKKTLKINNDKNVDLILNKLKETTSIPNDSTFKNMNNIMKNHNLNNLKELFDKFFTVTNIL